MATKLTLTVEERIIEKAKAYAKQTGRSLSELVENYLDTALLDYVSIVAIDLAIIKKSLLSKHKDFEDAIQIFAAHSIKNLDFIVTRNVKDFKKTEIAVLPPDELLLHL